VSKESWRYIRFWTKFDTNFRGVFYKSLDQQMTYKWYDTVILIATLIYCSNVCIFGLGDWTFPFIFNIVFIPLIMAWSRSISYELHCVIAHPVPAHTTLSSSDQQMTVMVFKPLQDSWLFCSASCSEWFCNVHSLSFIIHAKYILEIMFGTVAYEYIIHQLQHEKWKSLPVCL
jgi:hypothetical protein